MGTTINCPEVRRGEFALTAKERAEARDSYVRNFDRQFREWSEIAKCCIQVRNDRDFELLGFHSWDAWLLDAAPASRRYIYLAVELYTKLIPDVSEAELSEIPLGSAKVLTQVSSAVRRHPKARTAARQKPAELLKSLQKDFPEQHIESRAILHVTQGQADVLEDARESYEVLKGEPISSGEFLEFLVTHWLDEPCEADESLSNRQRAQQLQSVNDVAERFSQIQ